MQRDKARMVPAPVFPRSTPRFRGEEAALRLLPVALLLAALGAPSALQGKTAPREAPAAPKGPVPCPASIPDLYEKVSPAVVSVAAMSIDPREPVDRLSRVAGSGVIVDPTGLVVTNSHVVFGSSAISVTLDDGTVLPARIVGIDPMVDLALLRIPKPETGTLPTARLEGTEKLRVGDEVFAIGNPFGLEQTLTRGVVSAVNRVLPGASWSLREPMIQTDAAINHGNSGGPLVDRCGNVVGINTAILPDAQGIGFAIPAGIVRSVLPELAEKGRVIRPWLGVQGQLIPPVVRDLLRVPPADGLLVEVVEPDSPAARAGVRGGDMDVTVGGTPILLGGDFIVELNGTSMGDPGALLKALGALKVGDAARMTLLRGSERLTVEMPVLERPILPQDVNVLRTGAPVAARAREAAPAPAPARLRF
jgi:S1-C subfamily serine protease